MVHFPHEEGKAYAANETALQLSVLRVKGLWLLVMGLG